MIYKIRIILDAEEDIFRDIEIGGESNSMEDFHNALTQAFGFWEMKWPSLLTPADEEWKQDEEIANCFDMSEKWLRCPV